MTRTVRLAYTEAGRTHFDLSSALLPQGTCTYVNNTLIKQPRYFHLGHLHGKYMYYMYIYLQGRLGRCQPSGPVLRDPDDTLISITSSTVRGSQPPMAQKHLEINQTGAAFVTTTSSADSRPSPR